MSSNGVNTLSIVRVVTFGESTYSALHVSLGSEALSTLTTATTILFALIVMCISASLIALTEPFFYYKFSALSLSTSLLTMSTVIPMWERTNSVVGCVTEYRFSPLALRFVIDKHRQGSVFSYIVVEISWLCKVLCLTRRSCMLTVTRD